MRQKQSGLSRFVKRQNQSRVASTYSLLLASLMVGAVVNTSSQASAQIVPDNTLPVNSNVPVGCTVCTISGGTARGMNLFHSFSQFSVPTSGIAWFNNDAATQNILTRVTGGSASTIDGTLRANGIANLFSINPSGIIFGPNTHRNTGGSFLASTANSLRFADGSEFNAVNPVSSFLLSVSVPLGLKYGSTPGAIVVQGPGNDLYFSSNGSSLGIGQDQKPPGLQVSTGQTLALLGGDVLLKGGNLTAQDGRIELASVSNGMVTLTPTNSGWAFNYANANNFGSTLLSQAASADVSGNSGGTIQVQGKQLSLIDGSALLSLTNDSGDGGGVFINTTDSVALSGKSIDPVNEPQFPSSLLALVNLNGTGQRGILSITAGQLMVTAGAQDDRLNQALSLSYLSLAAQAQGDGKRRLQALIGALSEARQGFVALPGVVVEAKGIATQLTPTALLEQKFTQSALQTQLEGSELPIVNLAAHGQFSSTLDKTFILTWDQRLTVNGIRDSLKARSKSSRRPIELMVLSACETAEGDKRAALGLAGIAVRSGARSTLASLWSVNDASTTELMMKFYQSLTKQHLSKTEALRQGQLALLHSSQYQHPFY